MDDFINVIKRDPQVQIKRKDMLDEYDRLPYNYQSKIRDHSCLISSNIFKRVIY